MKPRISMITLGVRDLARAARFYEEGLGFPRMDTPSEVAFFTLNGPMPLCMYVSYLACLEGHYFGGEVYKTKMSFALAWESLMDLLFMMTE
jgi:catechol 2,3-dioxygenase-like lactoylglutathione lyase family enzyme